ncbi:MAG: FxLYD domain-containing protein [Bryobacteraceae bacterium]
MASSAGNLRDDRSSFVIPLVVIIALIPILGAVWWFWGRNAGTEQPTVLTAEAKAYVASLKLADVNMKATANYVGATVVEVTGQITNAGERTLELIELNCVFYDPYNTVVKRERVPIVRSTLKPGETQSFRLPFEEIPESWNQSLPQLVIANIVFVE